MLLINVRTIKETYQLIKTYGKLIFPAKNTVIFPHRYKVIKISWLQNQCVCKYYCFLK